MCGCSPLMLLFFLSIIFIFSLFILIRLNHFLFDLSQQNEKPADDRIGNAYHKAAYFQYTDQTFTEQVPKPNYSGILGPVIAGEVGDVILVHFFNNASRNFSIHPHGVFYEKGSEGIPSSSHHI